MNILLIAPASGKWRNIGKQRLFNGKTFRFSLLSLLTVAAATPKQHTVRIVDEQVEEIPWDTDVDVVGITCMTALAPRAYEITKLFQARGVPVILGGMHPSLCPDEASQHADAIVIGDAQGIWEQVLLDIQNNCLQKVYQNQKLYSGPLLSPPRNLLKSNKYSTINAIEATRGCSKGCSFCAVSAFHQCLHKRYPVEDVIGEIENTSGRVFIFVDDNLTADRDYAKSLFERLIPLRKKWISQTTLEIAMDDELLNLMSLAGCVGVFVGMETFNEQNLNGVQKAFNKVEYYQEAVRRFHQHGIGVEAGIVFGFDHDQDTVFEHTLQQPDKIEIDAVQFSILTPLPGTPAHQNMKARIKDSDWANYDFHHVVFQPKRMTADALQAGHDWVTSEFYKPWRIARRMLRCLKQPQRLRILPFLSLINTAYFGRVTRFGYKGWNPALGKAAVKKLVPEVESV